MPDRDWPTELEGFLNDQLRSGCQTAQRQQTSSSPIPIHPPLASDEARHFMLGMEAGLFEVDSEGFVHGPLIDQSDENAAPNQVLNMLVLDSTRPRLARERICQMATASALVLDRGWLLRQIMLEPGEVNQGINILVRLLSNELVAAVTVKRTPQELAKLRSDFCHCCRRGNHPIDNCGFPQNHPQFEFCASRKPQYLWAVAPGADVCFKLNYTCDGPIRPDELSTLPPRSRLEMEHPIIIQNRSLLPNELS